MSPVPDWRQDANKLPLPGFDERTKPFRSAVIDERMFKGDSSGAQVKLPMTVACISRNRCSEAAWPPAKALAVTRATCNPIGAAM